jgi:hypothetical protein
MEAKINYVVTVEFHYNSIPNGESNSPFKVERCRYTVAHSIEDAVESGDEVLELLEKEGYKRNVSFKLDNPNSYRFTVRCYSKGCEAIVKIEDFGTCSTEHIVNTAKKSLESTKEYVNWLLKD